MPKRRRTGVNHVGPDGRPWRNSWAQEWAIRLAERVPGNEDAGTGAEQGIKPDPVLKARRARESKRLRRARRWPKWKIWSGGWRISWTCRRCGRPGYMYLDAHGHGTFVCSYCDGREAA